MAVKLTEEEWEDGLAPRPKRFWTYSRSEWDPRWWNKIGIPQMGAEEWGRRTIIVGTWLTGYLCIVLWTCWCSECHAGRGQTYWFKHRNDYKHLGKIHGPGSTFTFNDDKWTVLEVSQEVHISGCDQLRLLATYQKFCKCGDRIIPGDRHVCDDLRGEWGSFQRDRESMMEEE